MKDPERCRENPNVEKRIAPLVEALDSCTNTRTLSSCQGHFGFDEPGPLSRGSYVEFRMPQDKFQKLEQATYELVNPAECEVKFDQYIPGEDLEPREQRKVVDEVIYGLTKIVEKLRVEGW